MFCKFLLEDCNMWRRNGFAHRKKGAATEWYFCGRGGHNFLCRKEYWENGEFYFLYDNGTKEFYLQGKIHRLKGPAIEYSNSDKEWWIDGKRHREDGPAVIYGNKQFWFENGEFIECIV